MSNISNGPGQKQDPAKRPGKDNKSSSKNRSERNADTATGPNWDKLSKGSEGDTGQNAGVFK